MSLTSAGIRVWDSTEAMSVHGASSAMGASLNTKVNGKYANVAARDAAYSGLTSAEKEGIQAWVTDRGSWSYWDPTSNRWEWMSVHRKVSGGVRASAANTAVASPGLQIIAQPAVVLPPGNRLIHISASAVVTNLSTTAINTGRAYVLGLSDGDNWMQIPLGPQLQGSVSRQWYEVKSGTIQYQLYGLQSSAPDPSGVSFTRSWIQVFDLGACDD